MTGVELTEAEVDLIVVATALFGWAPQAEAMEAVQKVTAQIVAARLAPVEAERDSALAVAKSMDHFAEVAERCEAKSNEYAAENRRLTALVEAGLGLIRAEADKYDHPNQWVARDLLHSVAKRIAALGGAK